MWIPNDLPDDLKRKGWEVRPDPRREGDYVWVGPIMWTESKAVISRSEGRVQGLQVTVIEADYTPGPYETPIGLGHVDALADAVAYVLRA